MSYTAVGMCNSGIPMKMEDGGGRIPNARGLDSLVCGVADRRAFLRQIEGEN